MSRTYWYDPVRERLKVSSSSCPALQLLGATQFWTPMQKYWMEYTHKIIKEWNQWISLLRWLNQNDSQWRTYSEVPPGVSQEYIRPWNTIRMVQPIWTCWKSVCTIPSAVSITIWLPPCIHCRICAVWLLQVPKLTHAQRKSIIRYRQKLIHSYNIIILVVTVKTQDKVKDPLEWREEEGVS